MTRFHDSFDAMIRGEVEPPPVAKLIGMRLVSYDRSGTSQFEMEAGERHWNPMGTLHGGVLCDLADIAMGFAFARLCTKSPCFVTLRNTTFPHFVQVGILHKKSVFIHPA